MCSHHLVAYLLEWNLLSPAPLLCFSLMRALQQSTHSAWDFPLWKEEREGGEEGKERRVSPSLPVCPPGEGSGNPLQYSGLENPMDRGAWRAPVRGVAESWPRLSEHIPPMPCASQLQATAHTKYSYHFYLPHFSPQITLLQSHGSSLCLPGNLSCLLPCYDFIS